MQRQRALASSGAPTKPPQRRQRRSLLPQRTSPWGGRAQAAQEAAGAGGSLQGREASRDGVFSLRAAAEGAGAAADDVQRAFDEAGPDGTWATGTATATMPVVFGSARAILFHPQNVVAASGKTDVHFVDKSAQRVSLGEPASKDGGHARCA